MNFNRKTGYLVLEDGSIFQGYFFGAERETSGEVVFNTSMTGYQEILTDPSYYNQLVTMTYPEIGNYGIMEGENESSSIQVKAMLVRHYVDLYSNVRASISLAAFLESYQIPALSGIDTRKLTLKIREKGAMRGGLFFKKEGALESILANVPDMIGQNLADVVSVKGRYPFGDPATGEIKLAVIDFGIKRNILRIFEKEGFYGTVFPSKTDPKEITGSDFDAVFFSNGPGDPKPVRGGQDIARAVIQAKLPSFGICLGHQILGIALGASSFKLKFGHRGGNQPVLNGDNSKVEITSQNHGFSLNLESLSGINDVEVTHKNLNDNTVEGLRHKTIPLMSVQYHPESAPGPHDARYLFSEFKKLIKKNS